MSRDRYIGEIKNRWNDPRGRQLRLLKNRWLDDSPGWGICSYDMYQFKQQDKILGALVQLCMARQRAPPWESNNHARRKGGRAARRRRPLGLKSSPLLPFSMRTRSDGLGWRSCVSAHSPVGGQHQGGARRPAAATPSCRALPLSRLPHATRWRTLRRRNTCRRGRSSRRC